MNIKPNFNHEDFKPAEIDIPKFDTTPEKQGRNKKGKVTKADLKRLKNAENVFLEIIESFKKRAPQNVPRDKSDRILYTDADYQKFENRFKKQRKNCEKIDKKDDMSCMDGLPSPEFLRDRISSEAALEKLNKRYPFAKFTPGQNIPILGGWASTDEDLITIEPAGKVTNDDSQDQLFVMTRTTLESAYNHYTKIYKDVYDRSSSKNRKKFEKRHDEIRNMQPRLYKHYDSLRARLEGGFNQIYPHPNDIMKQMRNSKRAIKIELTHRFKGRVHECEIEYQEGYFDGYALIARGVYDGDECMMYNIWEESREALTGTDFWFTCQLDSELEFQMSYNSERGKPYARMRCGFYQPIVYLQSVVNTESGEKKYTEEVTDYIRHPSLDIHMIKLDDGQQETTLQTFSSLGAHDDDLP